MKKIGVIGGMGPEATLDFYGKIIQSTPAGCDQDHIPVAFEVCPQIPDRTKFIVGQGEDPVPLLIEASQNLINVGSSVLCMPCNTAHYFIDDLSKKLTVPFINMIDCVQQEILRKHPDARSIGLLATSGTIQSRVYHRVLEKNNMSILRVTEDFQNTLMDIIYAVKSGRQKEIVPTFQQCINTLENQGVDVIITGCTELPLLMPYISTMVPTIDPTLSLAESVVKFSLGWPEEG
ncbi:MAG: aspartate racemase [Alphaproteobacteria bacterium]|nr:MAG: aspartate racemase [Alphaproteobacteria bacterium]